jgi:uncharacterized membrane protein YoaK (UPF0700 family)
MLGFAAGYVDGCTFVALFGLFVAQVTGSFVIAGAVLVVREHGALVKLLAVPAFLFGVTVATAVVSVARHTGRRASPIVLGLESLLLAGLLATVLVVPDVSDPDQPAALVAGLFGLCAMGVQSAFVRLFGRCRTAFIELTNATACYTGLAINQADTLLQADVLYAATTPGPAASTSTTAPGPRLPLLPRGQGPGANAFATPATIRPVAVMAR